VGKQQTRKAVSAASRLALALPAMRMSQDSLDTEPMMLNARNGVVDLATGERLKHSPDHRMTLQAAAVYRPDEEAPQWDEFLRRVQPDPEMRAYLQRVAGYCATGRTDEQAMFLWHGSGANGKSVAQAVIAHVLGDYAQTIPTETLMASSVDGRIPNDVARMAGRRFLVASETKQGRALDEQKMKQLTGGDTVAARYMRAEYFEFRPVGKIQLTTNHLPRMSDDAATWRRIHLITWPVVIPEHERDGFLQERLIAEEANGILTWIVKGCVAWQTEGLTPPPGVVAAKEAYRVEEDVVQQFIEAMVDVVPPVNRAAGRSTAEIFAAFEYWAQGERLGKGEVPGQKALTARLKKHGFSHVRSGGWNGFP
jgi:putative DNA primase/helicase